MEIKKFDFSDPDLWKFEAICYLRECGSDETAEYWEQVMHYIMELNGDKFGNVWDKEMADESAAKNSRFSIKGTCDHCGAWFDYGAAYKHIKTNEIIIVGNQCASKYLCLSKHEYADAQLRKAVKAAKTKAANKLRRLANEKKIEFLLPNRRNSLNYDHEVSRDLRKNFIEWGALSIKQWKLAKRICFEDWSKPEELNPIPEVLFDNRVEICGTVIGLKSKENPYDYNSLVWKMLVKDDRGFKVWGSVPTSLEGDPKGKKIKFVAKLNRSDDRTFGFFSRPSKAEYIN